MSNNDLAVTSLNVTTRMQATPGGAGLQRVYVVSYKIGSHGPFEDVYAPADYTAAKVKAAIDAQLQTLRTLSQSVQMG